MMGRLVPTLAALLLFASASVPVAAQLAGLGIPIEPHGFPAYYQDANGLRLELALPANQFGQALDGLGNPIPSGSSTRPDLIIFDPIDPANPEAVKLGVGDEAFWWMADSVMTMPGGGKALLVLGLEAAFGGAGSAADGQQISFGRVRIRVDTPAAGLYTVTTPYGPPRTFNAPAGKDAINVTFDIGAINQLTPALGFSGALAGEIGPFLTWTNYLADPTLKVLAPDGTTVLEQYIGNPNIPHAVTGSPTGNNFFRIEGLSLPGGKVETTLFQVMGKVYLPPVPHPGEVPHVFPNAPLANLFAVGPVNRATTADRPPVPVDTLLVPPRPEGLVAGGAYTTNYPEGYPFYFQDTVVTGVPPVLTRTGGLQLTYCPPFDPMCISAPIDPLDPNSAALRVGEESFFWTAEAFIDEDTTDVANLPAGLEGLLVLAMEGAFGGAGTPLEKQQIAFARLRIRIDTPVAGTYTVTHPYGEEVFTNVPRGRRAINTTVDVMISDPANPDQSFVGALYGVVGPTFLTWSDFNIDPALNNPQLVKPSLLAPPASPVINYIGDPGQMHAVKGSPTGNNFFRIRGPNGIDVQTARFAVSGKVYDPSTFNLAGNPLAPVANPDAFPLNTVTGTIPVLENDFRSAGVPANQANVTVAIVTNPVSGTAVVNANRTVTYTPNAALITAGGVDTFTYNLSAFPALVPPLVSNNATVTVTVTPVETITFTQTRFDVRRLRLELVGTSNFPGTVLTVFPGTTATGTPLGTINVGATGLWSFRATARTNLTSVTLRSNSPAGTTVTQTLRLR